MSVQDVIKSSFLEQFNSELSTMRIITMLFVVAILGIYIFFVYRLTCRKEFYNKSFAISLVVISMTTSVIILTIQSSIVISLGMVGALSIVRFRTAIKDPMDLAFLFWSISVGIICGANIYEIAIEGSLVITVVMLVLHMVPNVKPSLLLLVHISEIDAEEQLSACVKQYAKNVKTKSRNISAGSMDLIMELKTTRETELVKAVSELKGIEHVTLMSHDGEVTC